MTDGIHLTPEELESFYENGFVGPFQVCTPEEMSEYRARIEREVLARTNAIYGFEKAKGRDRHLDSRAVYDLMTKPAIVERLAQILGPDLLVWRSTFFFKPPYAPATVWHQANVFKEFVEHPILEPPDPDDIFQLTTWIAVDEATLENGCVYLIPGTHKNVAKTDIVDKAREKASQADQTFGSDKGGFFGYDLKTEVEFDESDGVPMPCKPGEFFIFTQRTMHGSPPNKTGQRRLAFNFRTVRTDVKVYHHYLPQGKIEHYGETWNLEKWGCVALRGEDRYGFNKMVDPPPA